MPICTVVADGWRNSKLGSALYYQRDIAYQGANIEMYVGGASI